MNFTKSEKKTRKAPMLCSECVSVLSNFERKRCKDCKFVARYVNWANVVYFVAQDYDKKFRTFFIDAETKKRRVYQRLEPTFSFVEAQSLLNHHAIDRNWRTYSEAVRV